MVTTTLPPKAQSQYYKRAAGALFIGLTLSVAGYNLGHWVQLLYDPSKLGSQVPFPLPWLFQLIGSPVLLSATILIAATKEALSFLPAARKILRGDSWIELWMPSFALFCSLFALGFALPNKIPGTTTAAEQDLHQQTNFASTVFLNLGNFGMYHSSDPRQGLLTLAVTFSKDNPSHASEEGLTVEDPSQELLKRVGHALAECEGDNGLKARVEVVGFASTLGPQDKPDLYQRVELRVAQARADNVKAIIEEGAREVRATGALPIEVQAPPWPSYEQMEKEIRFQDLIDKHYDEMLGNFTRRAEVRVKSAGKCEVRPIDAQKVTVAQR